MSPLRAPIPPLFYVHLELDAGATAELPAQPGERSLYVASGEIEVGGDRILAGQMAVLAPQASSLRAIGPLTVVVLGGEPVGERFLYWNFVSCSQDRLRAAAEDWKAGRMRLPDGDNQEFMPLPDDIRTLLPKN